MTGKDAVILLLQGKKIRRSIWNSFNYWYLFNNNLHNERNIKFNMTFNELIMGDDWEVYEEVFDTFKAIEALKFSKKIKKIDWDYNQFLYMENGVIYNQNNQIYNLEISEPYNEKWNILEDKVINEI